MNIGTTKMDLNTMEGSGQTIIDRYTSSFCRGQLPIKYFKFFVVLMFYIYYYITSILKFFILTGIVTSLF